MSAREDGGPAFPLHSEVRPSIDGEWCGMSLRAYFAAHAPAVPEWWWGGCHKSTKAAVDWALSYADAMLEAMK